MPSPFILEDTKYSATSGTALAIPARSGFRPLGEQGGDIRFLYCGADGTTQSALTGSGYNLLYENEVVSVNVAVYWAAADAEGNFPADSWESSNSEARIVQDLILRDGDVNASPLVTYSSSTTVFRFGTTPSGSADTLALGLICRDGGDGTSGSWSSGSTGFIQSEEVRNDISSTSSAGIRMVIAARESYAAFMNSTTISISPADGSQSQTLRWPYQEYIPPPSGPSFTRDGVLGENIGSLSGVDAANIANCDGVAA